MLCVFPWDADPHSGECGCIYSNTLFSSESTAAPAGLAPVGAAGGVTVNKVLLKNYE